MARLRRFVAIKQPHLIAQTAFDNVSLFRHENDFVYFLELLKNSAKVNVVAIHAYALLPQKILLLATPSSKHSLSQLMQWIGRRYIPFYNGKYGRTGPLWRSRFKAAAVEDGQHLLQASQFVDESADREAGAPPNNYRWSSFHAHIGISQDPLLTDHSTYWSLGNTPFAREARYRQLLERPLSETENAFIENCLRGSWVIGSPAFAMSLEKQAGRRLRPGVPGRPRREVESAPSGAEPVPN